MKGSDWTDIGEGLIGSLSYVAVGVVLLAVGFYALDLLTPGKLSDVIMGDRNRNAARVASAGLFGESLVIGTSVLSTHDDFVVGLVSTAIFGLVGVLLQVVVFLAVDLLTPGKLGDTVCDPEDHPASWFLATSLLAAGIIVATCIS